MDFRKDRCDDLRVPRPATGKTPVHNVRVAPELWKAAQDKAKREGRTMTDVIVSYLKRYIAAPDRKRSDGE